MFKIKKYGVKKTWDNKYETYAYIKDTGDYLTPITWLREEFKNKSTAIKWLDNEIKHFNKA